MTWRLVPLYGLQIIGDQEGNTNPVFGDDATIIGVPAVALAASTVIPEHVGMFVGGAMKVHAEKLTQRPPMETFIEFRPHSFIAVRRSGDSVRPYAQSLLALLSASMYYHGGMIAGFSIDPSSQMWGLFIRETGWNKEIKFEATFDIFQNNHVRHVPLNVTEEALRKSWNDGTPILDNPWRIFKDDPFTTIFVGTAERLNSMQRELREAGMAIAAAHTARPYMAQVLFAVSAIEQIFSTRDFKELTQILGCFFEKPNHQELISEILDARHVFAHRARSPQTDIYAERLAQLALRVAWISLEIAITGAAIFDTPAKWLEFLRKFVSARELSRQLSDAEAVESLIHGIVPVELRSIRQDPFLDAFILESEPRKGKKK